MDESPLSSPTRMFIKKHPMQSRSLVFAFILCVALAAQPKIEILTVSEKSFDLKSRMPSNRYVFTSSFYSQLYLGDSGCHSSCGVRYVLLCRQEQECAYYQQLVCVPPIALSF